MEENQHHLHTCILLAKPWGQFCGKQISDLFFETV